MSRGLYLVLEGGDAAGKSHQTQMLAAWLRENGHAVRQLREPGSTPTGEALRGLLLDPKTGDLSPLTEALLFSAARREMVCAEVAPALERGELVLVERCYLSTLVYQGVAGSVPLDLLRELTTAVHDPLWPDRIFLLDVDPSIRAGRARRAGEQDRIETRGDDYHAKVRRGYIEVAAADPRVEVIDAAEPLARVQDALRLSVTALLERREEEGGGR